MLSIFLRTLLIYLLLIATVRLMGKRQIGELEVSDLVTTLLLSELAALPLTDLNIPVSHSVIPMVTLLFLEVASSVVLIRLPRLKGLVSDRPTVLIRQGELSRKALLSARLSVEELMGELRQQGYIALDQIEDAILEKNGKITLLPKPSHAPPTAGQLGLKPEPSPLMHVVLSNGRINREGLRLVGRDRSWLLQELKKRSLAPEELFCATADPLGNLYLLPEETKQERKRKP